MTTTAIRPSYLGSCWNCGTTYRTEFAGHMDCPRCANDPARIAERDAFLAEHPRGIFPMGAVKFVKISGKLGKKVCDESCTSARREGCTCQCGGRNHGKNWEV